MRLSLPRQQRLLKSREFQHVFRRSRRVSDDLFLVCARYGDQDAPRLGLAVSRKFARRAVDRNRIKRQARETFRHLAPRLARADFVVVNRAGATTASPAALRESLHKHFLSLSRKSARRNRRDSA